MEQTGSGSQKLHNNKNRKLGQWAQLNHHLLLSIIFKLGFLDCISVGRVCSSWKTTVESNKRAILERQSPVALDQPTFEQKICSLYCLNTQSRYEVMLPDYLTVFWDFVGLSCGYLTMLNYERGFHLFHPITKQEFHFPALPKDVFFRNFGMVPLLVHSTNLSEHFLLVVNKVFGTVKLSRRGGSTWRTIQYKGRPGTLVDLVFFKGIVYGLTNDGRIGKLGLNPIVMELLDLPIRISIPHVPFVPFQLVTSDRHLYMVSISRYNCIYSGRQVFIHKLDEENTAWDKVNDLGDEALFLSCAPGCSAVLNPTKWGGRSNCVYLLAPFERQCFICPLNGFTPLGDRHVRLFGPRFWYFSHRCDEKNSIEGPFPRIL